MSFFFYDSTVKETSLRHTPTQTACTHHIEYVPTHTHTQRDLTHTHTSITDFSTIAFYRQIKGISVRAVKPVTPPVICVRQSNSEKKRNVFNGR